MGAVRRSRHRHRLWLAMVGVLSAVIVNAAPASWPGEAAAQKIDALFAPFAREDSPGYVIALVKDGNVAFAKGYGQANLDDTIPLGAQSVFHLASLSKQFTAAAVASLILDGKLALDTPVARHIPQAEKYGPGLQIRHLLYMTSGLPEYTTLPRANGLPWFTFHYFTIDEAVQTALKPDKLLFAPGTQWAYANTNYMVLAKIVEQVSGQSLATFLQERIFVPLGMRATHLDDDTTEIVPHRATGYAPRTTEIVAQLASVGIKVRPQGGFVRVVRNSPHYGGSGVFSTVGDLAKWDENFYTHAMGGRTFAELMLRRERFAHDKDNDALGLVFRKILGEEALDYAGSDSDTSTYMVRFPAKHLTVICLSNFVTGNAEIKAKAVLDILKADGNF